MQNLLNLSSPPTAVFAASDLMAIGAIMAIKDAGLSVPEDIAVMGFDDIDMAAYAIPPLTTIRQPQFELGQWAMQMLLDLLNGEKPENQIVPGNLVIRQTTAGLLPYRRLLTP